MNKEKIIEHLIYKYEMDLEYLKSLNDEQLKNLYKQKENESLIIAKNPNKFFYIKSLPIPKEYKHKTTAKGGKIIFLVFIIMLIWLFVLFITVAFIKFK
ncbi:hypothetical protein ACXYRR_02620 [Mycoplasma sp. 246B]